MVLLKYGKYIEQMKLIVQVAHMQTMMIYIIYTCK